MRFLLLLPALVPAAYWTPAAYAQEIVTLEKPYRKEID